MICHNIGLSPISIIGFGRCADSSLIREPIPPANMTIFTLHAPVHVIYAHNIIRSYANPILRIFSSLRYLFDIVRRHSFSSYQNKRVWTAHTLLFVLAWQRPFLPGPRGPSTIGAGGLNQGGLRLRVRPVVFGMGTGVSPPPSSPGYGSLTTRCES